MKISTKRPKTKAPSATGFWGSAGRAAAGAGRFLGRQIVNGYRKIDPDVPRHLVQIPLLTYTLFASRHQGIDPGADDGHPTAT